MTDYQEEKKVVLAYYKALDSAPAGATEPVLRATVSEDHVWRGFHPFDVIVGAASLARDFWDPLHQSLTSLQRRMDIFIAGSNSIKSHGGRWVTSMGHLMGLFDAPWLGIQPTGKIVMLRYADFHRVENGIITDTAMYFDIPHLMMQAGLSPFPPQTGEHLVQPGPMTHDGLLFEAQPPEAGNRTLAAINAMISDLGQWNSGMALEDELRRSWHENMLWWGPAGIGSTFTIERYAKQHAGPFRAAFSNRSQTGHICRMAEGHYGGFFGWPNFTATLTGDFMGRPATGQPGDFRVIDLYRREGDKLAENWIFIDLLHFWKMQGVDILEKIAKVPRT